MTKLERDIDCRNQKSEDENQTQDESGAETPTNEQ